LSGRTVPIAELDAIPNRDHRALLRRCLDVRPQQRPTAAEIARALADGGTKRLEAGHRRAKLDDESATH
jgi:hypothetical protein